MRIENGMIVGDFEPEAKNFCESLKKLVEKPGALEALEAYLSYHFDMWLQKWMNTPENASDEIETWLK